jgi:hypothetical protein
MLFSTRVLKFWIMDKTNVYDFLHFLSLIKIKPNMGFGGKLALVDIWHKTHSFYVKEVENGSF